MLHCSYFIFLLVIIYGWNDNFQFGGTLALDVWNVIALLSISVRAQKGMEILLPLVSYTQSN